MAIVSLSSSVLFNLRRRCSNVLTSFRHYSNDTTSKKQAKIIKKLHKANKEIFGELLESKTEKLKKMRELKKLKKLELKQKLVSRTPASTLPVFDDEIDPDLTSTPIKKGARPGSASRITSDYKFDPDAARSSSNKETANAEANWMIKHFPQRAKLISRRNPELPQQSMRVLGKSDIQFFKKNDVKEVPEVNVKAAPTFRQLIAGLDATDLKPNTETKVIRTSKIPANDAETEISDSLEITPDPSTYIMEEVKEKEIDDSKENDIDEEIPAVSTDTDAPSAATSYDNPQRTYATSLKTLQSNIISYQYDYTNKLNTRLPSVSKILQATMSPEQAQILEKWQQKMIAQLGEDGFKKYKDGLFSNGKELHKNLQLVLSGTPREYLTIDDAIFGHWNSLQTLLPDVKDVQVLESLVAHPQLGYCGIVDCVAFYRDKFVLIDWKTSEKKKSFVSMTYDTPLQISAYIGALNHDPNYSFKVTSGLIVIAYQDGSSCQQFHLSSADLNKYWLEWLQRLNLYKRMTTQRAATEDVVSE